MKNFKSLLFIVIIALVSSKSYAFENVIGISGGTDFNTGDTIQQITTINQGKVREYNYIFKTNSYNSLNAGIEYQARFDKYILGMSLNTIINNTLNSTYKTKFYNADINVKTNSTDISMEGFLRFINTEDFGFNIGGSLGLSYFIGNKNDNSTFSNTDKIHQLYLIPRFIIDGEYKINKQFSLFGRINATVTDLDNVYYNTNLKPYIPANETIQNNKISSYKVVSYSLNIGIRYTFNYAKENYFFFK